MEASPSISSPFTREQMSMTTGFTIQASNISKGFGHQTVVSDLSFEVGPGEIFGMVGPNGAGKTTTMRILMNIIKADAGEIMVLGEKLCESTKNRIGYLPEERGLYRKITIRQSLAYLASLKGMPPDASRKKGEELLSRVGMSAHRDRKIEQLSKGMSQLIQFITTIIHNPEVIILDEPFAGLDPVNRETLKQMILELREEGKTIILSTHQMNEVEELCDRILMINHGQAVLYGNLADIRARFRVNSLFLDCGGHSLDELDGVIDIKNRGRYVEVFLNEITTTQDILGQLLKRKIPVNRFEVSTPSLHEIFIQVAKEAG